MKKLTLVKVGQLWDGTAALPLQRAAVLIEDKMIAALGPAGDLSADLESKCQVIDLPGATLLPGLIDSHVHLDDDGWSPLMMLACGITSVRDVGNQPAAIVELRQRQRAGQWLGPRIHSFGPLLDGESPYWRHLALALGPGSDVEGVVDALLQQGVDGYKTYVSATPEVVGRVVTRAHQHGRKVTCHCGTCRMSRAVELGVDCAEHVICMAEDVLEAKQGWHDLDAACGKVEALARLFLERRATLSPTVAVSELCLHKWGRRCEELPGYALFPAYLRKWFKESLAAGSKSYEWEQAQVDQADQGLRQMQQVVRLFHQAGVPMLAGSDSPFVMPGVGLQYELQLLAQAGIANVEVLRMATSNAARFLDEPQRGLIRPGMLADLLAVEGDPLRDITAVSRVLALWQEGRQLDPGQLRAQALKVTAAAPADRGLGFPPFAMAASVAPSPRR